MEPCYIDILSFGCSARRPSLFLAIRAFQNPGTEGLDARRLVSNFSMVDDYCYWFWNGDDTSLAKRTDRNFLHHLPLFWGLRNDNSEWTLHRENSWLCGKAFLGDVIQMEGDTLKDHRTTMSHTNRQGRAWTIRPIKDSRLVCSEADKDVLDQI